MYVFLSLLLIYRFIMCDCVISNMRWHQDVLEWNSDALFHGCNTQLFHTEKERERETMCVSEWERWTFIDPLRCIHVYSTYIHAHTHPRSSINYRDISHRMRAFVVAHARAPQCNVRAVHSCGPMHSGQPAYNANEAVSSPKIADCFPRVNLSKFIIDGKIREKNL